MTVSAFRQESAAAKICCRTVADPKATGFLTVWMAVLLLWVELI